MSIRQKGRADIGAGGKPAGTPYDDVYRTLQNDCRRWCIPVINEIFKEHYTGDEEIIPFPNEHFINRQDGAEQRRVTDSTFTIMGEAPKKYHIECQSGPDGSMPVRMFEYDSQIALDDAWVEGYHMVLTFPRSAVIFLRHNRCTPDRIQVVIRADTGEIACYIPIVRLQDYALQEILDKKLLHFIPFYIFSYEKRFQEIETEREKMGQLQEDYRHIRAYLDGMCKKGEITEYEKRTIIDLSKKVLESIAARYPGVREGVSDVMGGKVLDYEAKDILRQGVSQGIESTLIISVKNLVAKLKMTERQAMDVLGIPESEQDRYLERIRDAGAGDMN